MKNENSFTAACIRYYLGSLDKNSLKDLYIHVDPKRLNDLINRQNIAGFFYHLYSSGAFKGIDIPEDMIRLWKSSAGRNSIINEVNDNEALEITGILDNQNINYIYLKGLSTRLRSYDEDYIKYSVDIDLYIKKEDYSSVKSILLNNGYSIPEDHYTKNVGITVPFEEFERNEHEITFLKEMGKISVYIDLQWDFIDADKTSVFHDLYTINTIYDFGSAEKLSIKERGLKVLGLEAEFLNMAFHFAFHHTFRGAGWLIDICSLLNRNWKNMDLDRALAGHDRNLKKVVGTVLMLANEYISGKKMDKKWRKRFCTDRLLPFEYSYYRSMAFKQVTGISNSISLLVTKILLPYSISDRFRAFKYMFFNPDSISHRIEPEKKGRKIFLPFYLLKLLIHDIRRKESKA